MDKILVSKNYINNYKIMSTFPLSLTKTADPVTFSDVGQIIIYTYDVSLLIPVPSAGRTGPVSIIDDVVNPSNIIPVSSTVFFTIPSFYIGIYTITQADIDAGIVVNTATALINGVASSNTVTATITYVPIPPFLNVTKYGPDIIKPCDTIQYLINVSNTGGQPLTNVRIHDFVPSDLCVTSWFYVDQSQNATFNTTSSINFVLPTLEGGASVDVVICAKVTKNPSNTITNIVEVTSRELAPVRTQTSTDVIRSCNDKLL